MKKWVIAGTVVLAAVLGVGYFTTTCACIETPKSATASLDLSKIADGLKRYKADTGQFPATHLTLKALVIAPPGASGWKGPYLQALPTDPWGREYVYRDTGATPGIPEVLSYGADGKPGGDGHDADITAVWQSPDA